MACIAWLAGATDAPPIKPPPNPPCVAITPHPRNPIAGLVDMNQLRLELDLVHHAIKLVLYDTTKVTVEPDGALKLREYDRIAALLRHYGVINARIDWNPATRTIGIS
jgi:hypothetical protein